MKKLLTLISLAVLMSCQKEPASEQCYECNSISVNRIVCQGDYEYFEAKNQLEMYDEFGNKMECYLQMH